MGGMHTVVPELCSLCSCVLKHLPNIVEMFRPLYKKWSRPFLFLALYLKFAYSVTDAQYVIPINVQTTVLISSDSVRNSPFHDIFHLIK